MLLVERVFRERAERARAACDAPAPLSLEVGVDFDGGNGNANGPSGEDAYERALASVSPERFDRSTGPEEPMILMYTSGTTGLPKGALLPHRKALFNNRNARACFRITSDGRVLVVVPLFHSLGLQILALPALYCGAGVVIQEGFDAERV